MVPLTNASYVKSSIRKPVFVENSRQPGIRKATLHLIHREQAKLVLFRHVIDLPLGSWDWE